MVGRTKDPFPRLIPCRLPFSHQPRRAPICHQRSPLDRCLHQEQRRDLHPPRPRLVTGEVTPGLVAAALRGTAARLEVAVPATPDRLAAGPFQWARAERRLSLVAAQPAPHQGRAPRVLVRAHLQDADLAAAREHVLTPKRASVQRAGIVGGLSTKRATSTSRTRFGASHPVPERKMTFLVGRSQAVLHVWVRSRSERRFFLLCARR